MIDVNKVALEIYIRLVTRDPSIFNVGEDVAAHLALDAFKLAETFQKAREDRDGGTQFQAFTA